MHGVVVGERDELRTSRPCPLPGTEERGAVSPLVGPSPVDADGVVVVFASRSSRRRCSSYVVSSMLARLPAAGMGCLASSPSCAIYSQGKGLGIHSGDVGSGGAGGVAPHGAGRGHGRRPEDVGRRHGAQRGKRRCAFRGEGGRGCDIRRVCWDVAAAGRRRCQERCREPPGRSGWTVLYLPSTVQV